MWEGPPAAESEGAGPAAQGEEAAGGNRARERTARARAGAHLIAAMVAGMLMPLEQLRAIYEVLFREGVMVAKKDLRPRSPHPDVPGVTNLQVLRAMGSLRARGLVRETFAWRHLYWYLTNEGMVHLRQYLHLPPEIVPASQQRVRRPVAMVMPARRGPHVQSVQGPLSCPPKRGPTEEPGREEQRGYRRKEAEEGGPETPVVPTVSRGTLARPGPEPTPATGQRGWGGGCRSCSPRQGAPPCPVRLGARSGQRGPAWGAGGVGRPRSAWASTAPPQTAAVGTGLGGAAPTVSPALAAPEPWGAGATNSGGHARAGMERPWEGTHPPQRHLCGPQDCSEPLCAGRSGGRCWCLNAPSQHTHRSPLAGLPPSGAGRSLEGWARASRWAGGQVGRWRPGGGMKGGLRPVSPPSPAVSCLPPGLWSDSGGGARGWRGWVWPWWAEGPQPWRR